MVHKPKEEKAVKRYLRKTSSLKESSKLNNKKDWCLGKEWAQREEFKCIWVIAPEWLSTWAQESNTWNQLLDLPLSRCVDGIGQGN